MVKAYSPLHIRDEQKTHLSNSTVVVFPGSTVAILSTVTVLS
jgi:hypothetical protein